MTDEEIMADAKRMMEQGMDVTDIDEAILSSDTNEKRAYWVNVIDKMQELTFIECHPEAPPGEYGRWKVAKQMFMEHGKDAELKAAQRADEAIAAGDAKGESRWRDVMKKVQTIRDNNPPRRLHQC